MKTNGGNFKIQRKHELQARTGAAMKSFIKGYWLYIVLIIIVVWLLKDKGVIIKIIVLLIYVIIITAVAYINKKEVVSNPCPDLARSH
ncbi:hypothetical protein [Fluviicola sp.]|jgi:heme/copper-type cytochrome/quinol oxidase subunit 4|uniref:hypothetical protein n=1 Tax=Fluviicola sp. TaxID=1917219 RepID=UPI002833E2C3|nr:hypothetical protein [Fluviicola sp.]MDR0801722.1 hypothetical protein [Fluviicola sp.]